MKPELAALISEALEQLLSDGVLAEVPESAPSMFEDKFSAPAVRPLRKCSFCSRASRRPPPSQHASPS